jgi:hypothetical protein
LTSSAGSTSGGWRGRIQPWRCRWHLPRQRCRGGSNDGAGVTLLGNFSGSSHPLLTLPLALTLPPARTRLDLLPLPPPRSARPPLPPTAASEPASGGPRQRRKALPPLLDRAARLALTPFHGRVDQWTTACTSSFPGDRRRKSRRAQPLPSLPRRCHCGLLTSALLVPRRRGSQPLGGMQQGMHKTAGTHLFLQHYLMSLLCAEAVF